MMFGWFILMTLLLFFSIYMVLCLHLFGQMGLIQRRKMDARIQSWHELGKDPSQAVLEEAKARIKAIEGELETAPPSSGAYIRSQQAKILEDVALLRAFASPRAVHVSTTPYVMAHCWVWCKSWILPEAATDLTRLLGAELAYMANCEFHLNRQSAS